MKKIILLLVILISLKGFSQNIATLSIKARLVQTLAPFVKSNEDTSYVNLFHKWEVAYRITNPPSGTTQVSVDSVPFVVIAALYSRALSWPQGASSVGDDFKSDVATIRSNNSSLDNLLDGIDAAFAAELSDMRARGRKLLTGKNQ